MNSDLAMDELPPVQQGIQRLYDEASGYYRHLRWEKTRLTRFEHMQTLTTIEQELGPERVGRALELGCGPGTWTPTLVRRADSVTALDLSTGMLERARQSVTAPNVQFVQGDAARFRADEPYDRVISIRVLEYIPEWATIVGRLGDLVRPGGRAVLITKTPISVWRGTGRERWFVAGPRRLARRIIKGPRQHDFWQRYIGVGAMIRAMRDAGFVDIDVRPVIWGLPVYARGTMQYPIVPAFAEPAMLRLTESLWLWTLGRGAAVRRASLLFSESYSVSGRRA